MARNMEKFLSKNINRGYELSRALRQRPSSNHFVVFFLRLNLCENLRNYLNLYRDWPMIRYWAILRHDKHIWHVDWSLFGHTQSAATQKKIDDL